jgi:hypothetical protein
VLFLGDDVKIPPGLFFRGMWEKAGEADVQKITCQMIKLPIELSAGVTLIFIEMNYYLLINVKMKYGWTVCQSYEGNFYGKRLLR